MTHSLSDILSARWLIYRQEILNYFPLFLSYLNGNRLVESDFGEDKEVMLPKPAANFGIASVAELDNPGLPENSVAVIPIQGVLYSYKTQELINNIRKAESNPAVSSMLFFVNTPGGMVFLTDIAAEAIASSPLPSVAYVMNMAASAGMWLVSATDVIYASSQLDRFGSIGVKTSFTDINGFLKEKLGISVYDLYATKAVNKDQEVRALLAGDNQPIINDLDFTNEIFHKAIRDNLGLKSDSEVFSGGMYNAPRAIELGLAHKIGSLDQALEEASRLGIKSKLNTLINHH
ncbi:MAG: S49 family peptidase [Bacteroidales bacterium]